MHIHERSFTTVALDQEGSAGTGGRSSSVVFETMREDPTSRVVRATFQHFDRDALLAWITTRLAAGETVVLHPNSNRASAADPKDIER